ncbi:MAG: DUF5683 domain-containing protein [Cyclobacteriaceae bacterium]|nr:DUF5683 domain-containing protein [Cyclobacteriaceae bacterium]MDH4295099.1 DUF5683 domain-containing protein [Cyclobacteriaceae bacterium]MDH5251022.1 DUF5683 domain-containing protein [Cyclobacteriaceae bacterium]
MKKRALMLLVFSMAIKTLMAQDSLNVHLDDSLMTESRDTVLLKSYAARFDPRKALLYAAILPGLGQIYNKKYWKLPLVYGGFIALGYAINFYQTGYTKYKVELFYNLENGYTENNQSRPGDYYTTGNYRKIVDQYKRQRDFMMILMGGMYLLQIVDAHVDAHLKEFDLNPNLQLSIQPTVEQNSLIGRQSGISLMLRF